MRFEVIEFVLNFLIFFWFMCKRERKLANKIVTFACITSYVKLHFVDLKTKILSKKYYVMSSFNKAK